MPRFIYYTGTIMENKAEYFTGEGCKIYEQVNNISVMKKIKLYNMKGIDWCQV